VNKTYHEMNDYEQKQEDRKQRYLDRADNSEQEATSRHKAAQAISDFIPFGQPILVGHHSERHHRSDLKRIDTNMRKGCEAHAKAKHYRDKAESVGKGGISSDDPEAVVKLKKKIAKAEKWQGQMKAANKALKKGDDDALMALGMDEGQIVTFKKPDFCGRIGFPGYALTNNNANIRRMKKRLEQLESQAGDETTEYVKNGVQVVDNVEENRLQLFFPGKPSEEIRKALKTSGFPVGAKYRRMAATP